MRQMLLGIALGLGLAACAKPDHVEMVPEELTFAHRGDAVWVRAIFKDHQGRVYAKQQTRWTSSNEKVATVDNAEKPGNVTAVGPGHAIITAHGDGLEADLPVQVQTVEKLRVSPLSVELTLDGPHVPMKVEGLDVNGRVLKQRKAQLKCDNEKICNSDGENVWPAGNPGETILVVTLDDKQVKVPVTVKKK